MRILHLIDSLQRGGAEQAAVHLCNGLHHRGHQVFLCATRAGGPLARELDCPWFVLGKRGLLDVGAHWRLAQFLRRNDIEVVHAHSTSLFSGRLALLGRSAQRTRLVWHVHAGALASATSSARPYRLVSGRLHSIVAASGDLTRWARSIFGCPAVWLPNAVPAFAAVDPTDLTGEPGQRIVCVANFRAEKDHATLIEAFALLLGTNRAAVLFLVGAGGDDSTRPQVEQLIERLGLGDQVHILGERDDVPQILGACDIGVLSSRTEGLPLALIEYGRAGLAVVCTRVGECAEVLGEDRGLLVEPQDAAQLASALGRLLQDADLRHDLGRRFFDFVRSHYDLECALDTLLALYRCEPAPSTESTA